MFEAMLRRSGGNLIPFLLVSLVAHLAALWGLILFSSIKGVLISEKEPIYVEVVDLPPATESSAAPQAPRFFSDTSRAVEKETFPEPVKAPPPKPLTKPRVAQEEKGGMTAPPSIGGEAIRVESHKATGQDVPSTLKAEQAREAPKEAPEALPREKTDTLTDGPEPVEASGTRALEGSEVALKEAGKGAKEAPLTGAPPAPGAATREEAGRPRLFLSEERLAELTRQYEKEAPKGEKGKTLQLNTSELRYQKYLMNMKRRIEFFWDYPDTAIQNGWQGKLNVDFSIRSDGTVAEIKVMKSSGYPALDDAAVTALRLAAPFPPFPDDFAIERINIKGQFEYIIYSNPTPR